MLTDCPVGWKQHTHARKCARLLFLHDVHPPSNRLPATSSSSSLKMLSHFLTVSFSPQNPFMSACRHLWLRLCLTCIFFTCIYLSESYQCDSAGLDFTSHHPDNPLVFALCCLLLLPFIFPSPLILHNQQLRIPLYRKKKTTNQSLFVFCLELYSHFSLEAQAGLCPSGFKEAEMAADVGSRTKPRLSSALHRCPVNFSPWHPFSDAREDKRQVLME